MVDASTGNVVERYMYEPYGKATVLEPDWDPVEGNESAVANERAFQGQSRDAQTGLYWSRVRTDYHPTLAVFLARDGTYIDGSNLYQYCRSNPAALTDPMGLCGGTAPDPNAWTEEELEEWVEWEDGAWGEPNGAGRVAQNAVSQESMASKAPQLASNLAMAYAVDRLMNIDLTGGMGPQGGEITPAMIVDVGESVIAAYATYTNGVDVAKMGRIKAAAVAASYLLGELVGAVNLFNAYVGYDTKQGIVASQLGTAWPEKLGWFDRAVQFGTGLLKAAGTAAALVVGGEVRSGAPVRAAEGTLSKGSFSIRDWSGYPQGVPKPQGPFRLVEGAKYNAARSTAQAANRAIHQADPALTGVQIHEIQPVKFGGSPTDLANKVPLSTQVHQQVTNWWNALQRSITGG